MNYPENIKTTKAKLAYWFFRHLYIFDLGRGSVVGRFTTIIPDLGILLLVLDRWFISINKMTIALILGIGVVVIYILGYYYHRLSLDRINAQVASERNQFLKDIHDMVVKQEGKREEL